jgi:hypothetical protein
MNCLQEVYGPRLLYLHPNSRLLSVKGLGLTARVACGRSLPISAQFGCGQQPKGVFAYLLPYHTYTFPEIDILPRLQEV